MVQEIGRLTQKACHFLVEVTFMSVFKERIYYV